MKKSRIAVLVTGVMLAIVPASLVHAGTGEILQTECKARLGLPQSACKCIGDKAEADLNEKQQNLVIAVIKEDDALMQKLQAEASQEDIVKAGEFMTSAPAACRGQ